MVTFALSAPASASDDTCPTGRYQVDDDFAVTDVPNCAFKTIGDLLNLAPIVPSDRVYIWNGNYTMSDTIAFSGLTIDGQSRAGVVLTTNTSGPGLTLAGTDINLTEMTFTSTNGTPLRINATASRASLSNITVANATGYGLDSAAASLRVRDLVVYASTGVRLLGNLNDVDGLRVTNYGAAVTNRIEIQGSDGRFANVSSFGTSVTNGIALANFGANNTTLVTVRAENATRGIWVNGNIFVSFSDVNVSSTSVVGVYFNSPATSVAVMDNARIRTGGQYGIDVTDGTLYLTNSVIQDTPTGVYHSGVRLWMRNVTFVNHSSEAVRSLSDAAGLDWDGGSVARSPYGWVAQNPLVAGGNRDQGIANVSFSVSTAAVSLTSPTTTNWTNLWFVGNTVSNGAAGFDLTNNPNRPVSDTTIANNHFTNLSGYAVRGWFSNLHMAGNTLDFVRLGIQIDFSAMAAPLFTLYNTVDSTNLIDGHPVYYLVNVSNVQVSAGGSQVWVVNGTNVTITGLQQTSAFVGVQIIRSARVAVTDSFVVGNSTFGVAAWLSSGIVLTNLTVEATSTAVNISDSNGLAISGILVRRAATAAVSVSNVSDFSIDGITSVVTHLSVNVFGAIRGSITNISASGGGSNGFLVVRQSSSIVVDGVGNGFASAGQYPIYFDGSADITVRHVSFTGGFRGIFAQLSDRLHFEDISINSTRVGVEVVNIANTSFERVVISANFTAFLATTSTNVSLRYADFATTFNVITYDRSPRGAVENVFVRGVNQARGFFATRSDGMRLANFTMTGQNIQTVHFDNSANVVVDGAMLTGANAPLSGGYGIYMDTVTGAEVSHVHTEGFQGGVYFTASTGPTVHDCALFNSTSSGLQFQLGSNANVQRVMVQTRYTTALAVLAMSNVIVLDSAFIAEVGYGLNMIAAGGFFALNNTFASGGQASVNVQSFVSFSFTMVHNNFLGKPVLNPGGLGTWDGGFPSGGNYYSWASPGFLDELTGSGRNLPGYDGLDDNAFQIEASAYDYYALVDPWPPSARLLSPPGGSLIRGGSLINFTVSNYFDSVVWTTDVGPSGTTSYPHDISTALWADGWYNVTLTASDAYAPTVVVRAAFEVDSTPPTLVSDPPFGGAFLRRGTVINLALEDAHLASASFVVDGVPRSLSTLSMDTSAWAEGLHTILATATDAVGYSLSRTWAFFLDGGAPAVTSMAGPGGVYAPAGTKVDYAVVDGSPLAELSFVAVGQNASVNRTGSLEADGGAQSIDTTGWPDGCYDVAVTARDVAGWTTVVHSPVCIDSSPADTFALQLNYSAVEDVPFALPASAVVDLDWMLVRVWAFSDNGLAVSLQGAATYTFATPGTYHVHATFTDRAGNIALAEFTVAVADTTPPVPRFGLPPSWPEDLGLTLSAAASTDNDGGWADGASAEFMWRFQGPSATLTALGISPTATFDTPGTWWILLTLTDAGGNSAQLNQSLEVTDRTSPVAAASASSLLVAPSTSVSFTGSQSTDNGPADAMSFLWRFTAGGTVHTFSTPDFAFTFEDPGVYSVVLTVRDGAGNAAEASLLLRVDAPPSIGNAPPSQVQVGELLEWSPSLSDPDPQAADLTVSLVSGPSGLTIADGRMRWTPGPSQLGPATVVVQVSDGLASRQYTYAVTVKEGATATTEPGASFPLLLVLLAVAGLASFIIGGRWSRRDRHEDAFDEVAPEAPEAVPPRAAPGGHSANAEIDEDLDEKLR